MINFAPSSLRPDAGQIARIKAWTRAALDLPDDMPLMVTELHCSEPDCPPVETVIAVMALPGAPRQYKLLQPLATIQESDVAALRGRSPLAADRHERKQSHDSAND